MNVAGRTVLLLLAGVLALSLGATVSWFLMMNEVLGWANLGPATATTVVAWALLGSLPLRTQSSQLGSALVVGALAVVLLMPLAWFGDLENGWQWSPIPYPASLCALTISCGPLFALLVARASGPGRMSLARSPSR